jgi:crotonobetainyl-CoA:carnitine CoA-transferase CaiB-like acyl-CoA transferase
MHKYADPQPTIRTAAPLLGQHTDEILLDEVGVSRDELRALRARGVV